MSIRLRFPEAAGISLLLLGSIFLGAGVGHFAPHAGQEMGEWVDVTLLSLVTLLLFTVRFNTLNRGLMNVQFICLALAVNFICVPLLGYAIAALFLSAHPLMMVGLTLYFMAPCTDWFLGFTRLAKGNVALGSALLPINMVVQLLLYPLFLFVFTRHQVPVDIPLIGETLARWFGLPLLVAVAVRQALKLLGQGGWLARLQIRAEQAIPLVIALLVMEIFAANIAVILEHMPVFVWLLLAVFVFFFATFWLGEGVSKLFQMDYPEHALLTMTIAARNAPLTLAVTMAALPHQPLIYAALVIGMLVEFPHLTALRHILVRSSRHPSAAIPLQPGSVHGGQQS